MRVESKLESALLNRVSVQHQKLIWLIMIIIVFVV